MSREVIKVWLTDDGSIVEKCTPVVIDEDDPEDAAAQFMENEFCLDAETTECHVLIDGEIYACIVESEPVFRAHKYRPRKKR